MTMAVYKNAYVAQGFAVMVVMVVMASRRKIIITICTHCDLTFYKTWIFSIRIRRECWGKGVVASKTCDGGGCTTVWTVGTSKVEWQREEGRRATKLYRHCCHRQWRDGGSNSSSSIIYTRKWITVCFMTVLQAPTRMTCSCPRDRPFHPFRPDRYQLPTFITGWRVPLSLSLYLIADII